jgi:hypothetical protein
MATSSALGILASAFSRCMIAAITSSAYPSRLAAFQVGQSIRVVRQTTLLAAPEPKRLPKPKSGKSG